MDAQPPETSPEPEITPEPEPAQPPARSRLPWVILGVAVAALVAGGGAWAWTQFSGGGTQPEDVLPDSVVAFARVDLDPSASQKIEMMRLLRQIPIAEDELGLTSNAVDLRELFVERVLGDCELDFDADVEPWMGERVGFGALDNGKDFVLAIQVDDEKLARKGIRQFDECDDSTADASGVAFRDGYALVTEDAATSKRIAKAAGKSPLGATDGFADAMDAVGDHGIMSAWVDIRGIVESPQIRKEMGIPENFRLPEEFDDLAPGAMTLRANGSSLEIHGDVAGIKDIMGNGAIDPGEIAKDAVAVMGFSVPDELVDGPFFDSFLAGMSMTGEGPTEEDLEMIEGATGLDLREDIPTFYGADPTFVVGTRGLADAPTFTGPKDVEKLDISLRLHGDTAELTDLLERLAQALEEFTGVTLVVEETDDGAVLATTKDSSAVGRGLSDTKTFKTVAVGDTKLTALMFVNFDRIAPIVDEWDMPGGEDVIENLEPLAAVAMTSAGDSFSFRVSFDEKE